MFSADQTNSRFYTGVHYIIIHNSNMRFRPSGCDSPKGFSRQSNKIYMAQFNNEISLCGIVTEVSKQHLGESDVFAWRIAMFTEHHYAVDNYHERSHFSVLVFPDVLSEDYGERALKKGDWISVEGRVRIAVNGKGETFAEVIASNIDVVESIIVLP